MNEAEMRAIIAAEIDKRLHRYDEVCHFVVTYDSSVEPGATTDYEAGRAAGYQDGAEAVLVQIRTILGIPEGGE